MNTKPNPKCAFCRALKQLCLNCGEARSLKQFDDEMAVLPRSDDD